MALILFYFLSFKWIKKYVWVLLTFELIFLVGIIKFEIEPDLFGSVFDLLMGYHLCIAIACFWAAIIHFREARIIIDIPLGKLRSSAKGYAKFKGKGLSLNSQKPLISPIYKSPCLWYKFSILKKPFPTSKTWTEFASGTSTIPFFLSDGTGLALVDPSNAEVFTIKYALFYKRERINEPKEIFNGVILYPGTYLFHEVIIKPKNHLAVFGVFSELTHESKKEYLNKYLDSFEQTKILSNILGIISVKEIPRRQEFVISEVDEDKYIRKKWMKVIFFNAMFLCFMTLFLFHKTLLSIVYP